MDFQHRVGHKTGSGAPATPQELAKDRQERLRRLALETIDLGKDPYLMRNYLGQFECRLCLTLHTNEASYLAHTQGKKHQTHLARRAAKEKIEQTVLPYPQKTVSKHGGVKIGRPGYRVSKLREPETLQNGLLFEVDFPEIVENGKPRHRFMSAWEQKIEPPDGKYQYVLFAADPYETIAFKIPNLEVDRNEKSGKYFAHWDTTTKTYVVQFIFRKREERPLPALPQRPTTFLPIGARW